MNGTKVYDKDGNLVKIFASEHRRSVPLSEMSDTLINAFIAMEDENFYDHMGVDFTSILRAFLTNFSTGSIRQGASTITQQLARDMFLTLEQSMDRKVKEALLSFKIERTFSKDQILEMYLNKNLSWRRQLRSGIRSTELFREIVKRSYPGRKRTSGKDTASTHVS